MQADPHGPTETLPTTRELEHLLQERINRPFIELESLTLFLPMCIPLCNLLSFITNLRHVLGCVETASRGQTNVDELLRTIASFSRRLQERMTNSRQRAVDFSEICRLTAEAKRLR